MQLRVGERGRRNGIPVQSGMEVLAGCRKIFSLPVCSILDTLTSQNLRGSAQPDTGGMSGAQGQRSEGVWD